MPPLQRKKKYRQEFRGAMSDRGYLNRRRTLRATRCTALA